MFMHLINKRGQSGEGSMLIWIVVAIVAAIVVMLFFTGGFQVFSNLFKQAPQTVEAAAQACKLVATPETRLSYCDQWREVTIAGDTQLVNCQYPLIANQIDVGGSSIECKDADGIKALTPTEKGKEYCISLFKNSKVTEKTKVNDVLCSSLSCTNDFKGTVKTTCDATIEISIKKGFQESGQGICCLKK